MRLLKYLLVFFLVTPAFAQGGLVSYPPQKIMGFRGLDSRSSAPTVPDGRASDIQNIKLSAAFDMRKRPGYDTVNDATLDDLDIDSPAITGIFDSEYSDGTSNTLVFVGSKLKYDNAGTWSTVSSSGITSGKNNQWQCRMAFDSAVCTNDLDLPAKISKVPVKADLIVSDLSDTLTKVKTLVWYRNYLIFGNTVENSIERPTRFRWSDVGTIETYSDDNFVDISTFAGDDLIGFAELYGELYVFLTKSIWKVSLVGGDDIFVFKKIIDGIGAIARDSIQVVSLSDNRTAAIFLDERKKILMFTGASVVDLGAIIQPTLDTLNESRLQYAVSTFDGTDYILCASLSGVTENNVCFDLQIEILEWTKHTQIDANAMAQVEESASNIKTYFGNYDSFVYWMDNPDLFNDVDGATGIVDSVATINSATITGATTLIDADLTSGIYTGAIVRITSGVGAGQEGVVSSYTSTSLVVTQAFSTTPTSASVYSVGDIDAFYTAKHFDLGDSSREKTFLGMLIWAKEQANSDIDVSYVVDFGSPLGSETISLSPLGGSLWDTAIWDTGVWGTTGNKIYTTKFTGLGNFIQPKFLNTSIDEGFTVYGYNILAIQGDVKQ